MASIHVRTGISRCWRRHPIALRMQVDLSTERRDRSLLVVDDPAEVLDFLSEARLDVAAIAT